MVFIKKIVYLKLKDAAYVINLKEHKSRETHWIAGYVNIDNVTYFIALELIILQKKFKTKTS